MILENKDFILLNVRVVPRASKSEIVGEQNGALRVRISSPPVDGAANAEVVRLIAKTLCLSRSQVAIVSGHVSRTKQLRIDGVTVAKVRELLHV